MALTDKLTAIANAIRAKTGGTATMTLAEMPSEIASIPSGGVTPSGKKLITDTSETDVAAFATAQVSSDTLLAENIKKDVNILGVLGTFAGGGSLPSSISKIDGGSFTFASSRAISAQIPHNLGVIPKGVIVWTNEPVTSSTELYYGCIIKDTQYGVAEGYRFLAACNTPTSAWSSAGAITDISSNLTDTTFSLNHNSRYYGTNIEYKWLAWA